MEHGREEVDRVVLDWDLVSGPMFEGIYLSLTLALSVDVRADRCRQVQGLGSISRWCRTCMDTSMTSKPGDRNLTNWLAPHETNRRAYPDPPCTHRPAQVLFTLFTSIQQSSFPPR